MDISSLIIFMKQAYVTVIRTHPRYFSAPKIIFPFFVSDLRNKLRYLKHLPVTSSFEVCELEMNVPQFSQEVLDEFKVLSSLKLFLVRLWLFHSSVMRFNIWERWILRLTRISRNTGDLISGLVRILNGRKKRCWVVNGPDSEWDLKSGTPTTWNPTNGRHFVKDHLKSRQKCLVFKRLGL